MKRNILTSTAVLIGIFLFSMSQIASAATASYVNNPSDCPATDAQFPGQECPAGTPDICGVSSDDIPQCYANSTTSAPGSFETTNTQVTATLGGGYIIICFADVDSAAPFCDDNGTAICNRDASCFATKQRDTTCTADNFGKFTCGSCRSGFQDCNLATDVCEVQTGVTNYDNNGAGPTEANTNYAASCAAACDSS